MLQARDDPILEGSRISPPKDRGTEAPEDLAPLSIPRILESQLRQLILLDIYAQLHISAVRYMH